jgi:hypothetical protein
MDGTCISSLYKKKSNNSTFLKSKLFYSLSLFSIFLIYILLVSPPLENFFKKSLLKGVRNSKSVTLNYLTPLYGQEIYASEYTINTLASAGFNSEESKTNIKTEDTRVIAMQIFLLNYNSPMHPFAKTFIVQADKYHLDWRLVAAISGVESAFGNITPKGLGRKQIHNAWGWKGENKTPQGWSQFESWEKAIETVTKRIALGYGTHLTPLEIEATYCPPCSMNPAHLWANGVSRFMNELSEYEKNLK